MLFPQKKLFRKGSRIIIFTGLLASAVSALAEPSRVVLVKSALWTEYQQTAEQIVSVLENSGPEIAVEELLFDTDPGQPSDFWQNLIARQPSLIITVGTPATLAAISNVKNIPIIYTLVLKSVDDLKSNPDPADIYGVTLTIPVARQLRTMKQALPEIKRVGLMYSRSSAKEYQSAGAIAGRLGLRLVSSEIASERDIPSTLRRIISEVDVLWMPPDDIIYKNDILRFILLECFQNNVPIMAVSKRIASAGTPLALEVDYEDIGRQTAELAMKRLANGRFTRGAVVNPRKLVLYINEWVASRLRLNIPENVIETAITIKSGR